MRALKTNKTNSSAIFPGGSGLLLGGSVALPDVRGNFPDGGGKLPDAPASSPDGRGKLRDRSDKLPNRPAPFPDRPDKLPDGSGKLRHGGGKPKKREKPLFPGIYALSLTRPASTLSHPMREGRGEGIFPRNPQPSTLN
jgi:hypothetical protein